MNSPDAPDVGEDPLPAGDGPRPRLTRVHLRNFKSIRACDVELHPLTVLIGRNGSGKSNFIKSLEIAAAAWTSSLESSIRSHGGIHALFNRQCLASKENLRADRGSLELGLCCLAQLSGGIRLLFAIHGPSEHRWAVARAFAPQFRNDHDLRTCQNWWSGAPESSAYSAYAEHEIALRPFGSFPAEYAHAPHTPVAGIYRYLADALFLSPDLASVRQPQPTESGERLAKDACNIASVVARIAADNPPMFARISAYMRAIVPELVAIGTVVFANRIALEFEMAVAAERTAKFHTDSLSDGSLLALCVIVAAFAPGPHSDHTCLVVLEEPERGLHPAAANVLMDALVEASQDNQIVVTTHSSDLIDRLPHGRAEILIVAMKDGQTIIAPPDPASRKMLDQQLYTAGELHRMDQFEADTAASREAGSPQ